MRHEHAYDPQSFVVTEMEECGAVVFKPKVEDEKCAEKQARKSAMIAVRESRQLDVRPADAGHVSDALSLTHHSITRLF